jgi:molybdopterin-containing oxidoreductase family iron-sulfur binding subunit
VDLAFEAALSRARWSVHAGLAEDETAARADFHLPLAHFLETWGDGTAWDGTLTLAQPLIAPLHGARSELELLAALVGDGVSDPRAIVRRTHAARLGDDRRWARAVQDGLVAGPDAVTHPPLLPLPRFALDARQRGGLRLENGALELTYLPDVRVFDGRYANNAWLQELPDPFTRLTWGNAALIAPETAAELGVADGSVVTLELGGRTLTLPALHAPGQAPGSVRVALGYGRTRAGVVGGAPDRGVAPVGASAYRLRTTDAPYLATGLTVRPSGAPARLASTQHLHAIDRVGRDAAAARAPELVRTVTLAELADPAYEARGTDRERPRGGAGPAPVHPAGHRWGMVIDLDACIGCGACVVACTAENNVPVVGADEVRRGREMHWLRVDRYFSGPPATPGVAFLPSPASTASRRPASSSVPSGRPCTRPRA